MKKFIEKSILWAVIAGIMCLPVGIIASCTCSLLPATIFGFSGHEVISTLIKTGIVSIASGLLIGALCGDY